MPYQGGARQRRGSEAIAHRVDAAIERPGGHRRGLGEREFELQRDDQSNWFGPNRAAVVESFETAGFRVEYLDSWDYGARSTFRATAVPLPSRLTDATYEGLSSLHRHLTGIDREDIDYYRRDS